LQLSNTDTILDLGQITGEILFQQSDATAGGTGISAAIKARSSTRPDTGSYFGTGADLGFFVSGAVAGGASDNASLEALTIRAGGKVGIGTTSPGSALEINAAAATSPFIAKINTAEAARIDSSGRLLVGTSSARSNFRASSTNYTGTVQHESGAQPFFTIVGGSNEGGGPYLMLGHQRSGTVGGNTVLVSGDELGVISFHGSDGTNLISSAVISANVDGTPGTDDMPSRLVFSTTADGASGPTERMRINSSGQIAVAGAGSAAAPVITKDNDLDTGIFFPAADTIAFAEGASEAARIDSSGRLLVGASALGGGTNNTTKLEVNGGMRSFLSTGSGNVTFTPGYTFQDGLYAVAYRVIGQDKGFIGYVSCINGNATVTTLTDRGSSAPSVVAGPQIQFPIPGGNFGKRVTITLLTGLAD
jgi:hypothetical protein